MKIIGKESVLPEEKATLIEEVDENTIYFGYGKPGIAEDSEGWAIEKLFKEAGVWKHHWAEGTDLKDKVWEDREDYTYKHYFSQ